MSEHIALNGRWNRNGEGWFEQRFYVAPMVGCLRYLLNIAILSPVRIKVNGMLTDQVCVDGTLDVTDWISLDENVIALSLTRDQTAVLSAFIQLVPCDE